MTTLSYEEQRKTWEKRPTWELRNMAKALNIMPWLNTEADWRRLAIAEGILQDRGEYTT